MIRVCKRFLPVAGGTSCASIILLLGGCSHIEYPRVSAENYYSWLASSYSPIVQFLQRRPEGEGLCFHLDGGKAQILGFVTLADITSVGKLDPELRMRSAVYQESFAEGLGKALRDSRSGSMLTSHQKGRLLTELSAPAGLHSYVADWRRGWYAGYGYGEHFGRSILSIDERRTSGHDPAHKP